MTDGSNPKNVTINQVANGFIVKVGDYGLSSLKEPYSKETKVFLTFDDMRKYLLEFFGGPKQG